MSGESFYQFLLVVYTNLYAVAGEGANLSRSFNPQSWNAYAYVLGNPLANTDPDGTICPSRASTSSSHCSRPVHTVEMSLSLPMGEARRQQFSTVTTPDKTFQGRVDGVVRRIFVRLS